MASFICRSVCTSWRLPALFVAILALATGLAGTTGSAGLPTALAGTEFHTDTPGVVRSVGPWLEWHLRNSNSTGGADGAFSYGLNTDTPIVGDWNGDRVQKPGVLRPGATWLEWHLRNSFSAGPADIVFGYGLNTDTPIVGDWNGDGVETPGVVRQGGTWLEWHLRNSFSAGPADIFFTYGLNTDWPIVGDWDGDGVDTAGVIRPVGNPLLGEGYFLRNSHTAGAADMFFKFGSSNPSLIGDFNGDGMDTSGYSSGVAVECTPWRYWNLFGTRFCYGLPSDRPIVGNWDDQ